MVVLSAVVVGFRNGEKTKVNPLFFGETLIKWCFWAIFNFIHFLTTNRFF